jgi:hypothetical protein
MLIEPANDFLARRTVDESRKAAEIGEQQCRRDDLAVAAPDHALQHTGARLRAEIRPQGLGCDVRQTDAISDKAQRREDAFDRLEFAVGKAAGTVSCHGEHRAPKGGVALAEPHEAKGVFGRAQGTQLLEHDELAHHLRILEFPTFTEDVPLGQIVNGTALIRSSVAVLGGEGSTRQALVARPHEPQDRRRRIDGRHGQAGPAERISLRDKSLAQPLQDRAEVVAVSAFLEDPIDQVIHARLLRHTPLYGMRA